MSARRRDADVIAKQLSGGFKVGKKQRNGVGSARVKLLTGEIRGLERDEPRRVARAAGHCGGFSPMALIDPMTAATAMPMARRRSTLFSTSAGEVGADFDADDLVCDLTTADAMIQRLGRVNRRGDRKGVDASRVDIIAVVPERKIDKKTKEDKTSPLYNALINTFEMLKALPEADGSKDASPRATREDAVWQRAKRDDHVAPSPGVLKLTDMMVDALSLTSVNRRNWPLVPSVPALIPRSGGRPARDDGAVAGGGRSSG